jgi:hypothetical protein
MPRLELELQLPPNLTRMVLPPKQEQKSRLQSELEQLLEISSLSEFSPRLKQKPLPRLSSTKMDSLLKLPQRQELMPELTPMSTCQEEEPGTPMALQVPVLRQLPRLPSIKMVLRPKLELPLELMLKLVPRWVQTEAISQPV